MRSEPHDLPATALAAAVERHWGISLQALEYAPVGFGSYHWSAAGGAGTRWFLTADRVGPDDDSFAAAYGSFADLAAAYATAYSLRRRGLDFVVAPVPDRAGLLLRRVAPGWAAALFPYVEGGAAGPGPWPDPGEAAVAGRLVGLLHACEPPDSARRFSFALRYRDELFEGLDEPWSQGPYGEPARRGLRTARGRVEALLADYDRLAATILQDGRPWVLTHGEPHSANFIRAGDGALHLIDWDTARLAPAERDLALLPIDQPQVLDAYQETAGRRPLRQNALRLFRTWWDTSEICGYVHRFRAPHGNTPDDRASWEDLERYLQVERNWPDLLA